MTQAHAVSYSDDKTNNRDTFFQYDNNGNLININEWKYQYYLTGGYNPVPFKVRLYQTKANSIVYNAENMPIFIDGLDGLTTFTYDASGARAALNPYPHTH